MELIKNYLESLKAIYEHVGFVEDWVVFPIDDRTEMVWDTDGATVYYAKLEEDLGTGRDYCDDVYKQRFYKKWIYEGADLTMIFCDPGVDGMKWFGIFDNRKRVKYRTQ